jgi:hypothetical protein
VSNLRWTPDLPQEIVRLRPDVDRDVKYALRSLRRARAFSIVAVATL